MWRGRFGWRARIAGVGVRAGRTLGERGAPSATGPEQRGADDHAGDPHGVADEHADGVEPEGRAEQHRDERQRQHQPGARHRPGERGLHLAPELCLVAERGAELAQAGGERREQRRVTAPVRAVAMQAVSVIHLRARIGRRPAQHDLRRLRIIAVRRRARAARRRRYATSRITLYTDSSSATKPIRVTTTASRPATSWSGIICLQNNIPTPRTSHTAASTTR